jgi:hypothetical protein
MRVARLSLRLAAAAALAAPAVAASGATLELPDRAPPVLTYVLGGESSFTRGCFDPCLCPILEAVPLRGTLVMRRSASDDSANPFARFEVSEARLAAEVGDEAIHLAGSGAYLVGGEFAQLQHLLLDLSQDGAPAEHFDSGLVAGGGDFPDALAVDVSIHGQFCFDTLLRIRAKLVDPVSPRACADPHDCRDAEYCSTDAVCSADGTCANHLDCNRPGNDFAHVLCVGHGVCGDDHRCGWRCGEPAACVDLDGVGFGPCDALLGWGVLGGGCRAISGCGDRGAELFASKPACVETCGPSADLNGDGLVNLVDLAILREHFLTSDPIADIDGDGLVNLVDLRLMKRALLRPPGG